MGFTTFDQRNVQCVGSLFWQEAVFIRLKNEIAKNILPKLLYLPRKRFVSTPFSSFFFSTHQRHELRDLFAEKGLNRLVSW